MRDRTASGDAYEEQVRLCGNGQKTRIKGVGSQFEGEVLSEEEKEGQANEVAEWRGVGARKALWEL